MSAVRGLNGADPPPDSQVPSVPRRRNSIGRRSPTTRCSTPDGGVRPNYAALHARLSTLSRREDLAERQRTLEQSFLLQGITFTVYGAENTTERIIPTDLFPRIIPAEEWARIEAGLTQRLTALNIFLADIYGDQKILQDGVVPRELVLGAPSYRREMQRPLRAPQRLCERLRLRPDPRPGRRLRGAGGQSAGALAASPTCWPTATPRKRTFPGTYRTAGVRPVERYPDLLLATLKSMAADWRANPQVVVLTPGVYNSAYYEHAYLARLMGVAAGRGARPRGARQHGLHAHHRGPAPGGRDLSPGRRRLHRPPDLPPRFGPRRGRACSTPTAPATWSSPTRPAPASPTTRRSTPMCRTSSATTSARTPILPNVETFLCREPAS